MSPLPVLEDLNVLEGGIGQLEAGVSTLAVQQLDAQAPNCLGRRSSRHTDLMRRCVDMGAPTTRYSRAIGADNLCCPAKTACLDKSLVLPWIVIVTGGAR